MERRLLKQALSENPRTLTTNLANRKIMEKKLPRSGHEESAVSLNVLPGNQKKQSYRTLIKPLLKSPIRGMEFKQFLQENQKEPTNKPHQK